MLGVDSVDQTMIQSKRILILGAAGMLGHMLVRTFSDTHHVIGTISNRYENVKKLVGILPEQRCVDMLNVQDFTAVQQTILDWQPDVIINCIGIVKHKLDDSRVLDAILINAAFPHQLARLCEDLKIKLIQFSTDCVFSGSPGVKKLKDEPDATDIYGITKRLGEVSYGTALTLRTSFIGRQIVGQEELVEWVISQQSGQINAYKKALYSGLTTRALVVVVQKVIDRHINLAGLYQVASHPITKYDLISYLNNELRLNITIIPDTVFECDRTLDGAEFESETAFGYLLGTKC